MRFTVSVLGLALASCVAGCSSGVLPDTGDGSIDAGTHRSDGGTLGTDGALGPDGAATDSGVLTDGGGDVDAGSGDVDAGSGDVDAGSGDVDAGTDAGPIDAGFDSGGRDAGSGCMGGGTTMDGCCYVDGDCEPGHVCYGASCSPFFSRAGQCLAPPTDPMHCWDDTDCTGTMDRCMGARYCGCGGIFCGPDMMGTCGTGFPFP